MAISGCEGVKSGYIRVKRCDLWVHRGVKSGYILA